jgi:predicted amidohydrolase YtcJ
VLDRDFFTIPSDEIRDVGVDMTIVGGVVRYQRGDSRHS